MLSVAAGARRSTEISVSSPSCPMSFAPQQRSPPVAVTAQVKLGPAATSRAAVNTSVAGGANVSTYVPSPSSPLPLCPQQRTPPAIVTTQVCPEATEIDATFGIASLAG